MTHVSHKMKETGGHELLSCIDEFNKGGDCHDLAERLYNAMHAHREDRVIDALAGMMASTLYIALPSGDDAVARAREFKAAILSLAGKL